MKKRHLVTLGLIGAAVGYFAHKLYQNRDTFKAEIDTFKAEIAHADEVSRRIADDLIIIQKTINDINQQVPQLKELGQDFDYKYRLFEQDSKKRLDVIQKTMAKYQNQPASN